MFTYGREHERRCAVQYVRNPAQIALITTVVDAVHDLIEGCGSQAALATALRDGFTLGGAGVWENVVVWLRKASAEYPALLELWREFAEDSRAEVRYRVACSLDALPRQLAESLFGVLEADRSKKVSAMARSRVEQVRQTPLGG